MRPNKHQTVRGAGWLLVLGIGLGVGAGGAVARHELQWAFAWWESMRAMVGMQPPMETVPQPSELDRARAVQRRLRGQLAPFAPASRAACIRIRAASTVQAFARGCGEKTMALRVFKANNPSKIVVDVGLVVGMIPARMPNGSAILRIPKTSSHSITPHVLVVLESVVDELGRKVVLDHLVLDHAHPRLCHCLFG